MASILNRKNWCKWDLSLKAHLEGNFTLFMVVNWGGFIGTNEVITLMPIEVNEDSFWMTIA